MKLHRFGSTVAIAMAASLALTACGDDNPTADDGNNEANVNEGADNGANDNAADDNDADEGDATEGDDAAETDGADEGDDAAAAGGDLSGTLGGAGASAQEAAQTAWIAGFQGIEPGVTVNYDSVGSGAGISSMISGAVSFAGSDAYLDEEQAAEVQNVCGPDGAINVPVYISPIALPYNLPGVEDLNLSPETAAQIFNQEITEWNDAAIAADNPDADLPDTRITVVNRSDESGTTENFTEYLDAAAGDAWTHEPDKSWPVSGGEAAAQTSGVINVVSQIEGTIGYADASAVGSLSTVSIGVGDEFVPFSPEAAAAVVDASEAADTGIEGDLAIDLAHDTTESGAYPIVLVSYLIMCKNYDDANEADMVKSYAEYIVSEQGQQDSADAAGSAPISEDLRGQALESIGAINGG